MASLHLSQGVIGTGGLGKMITLFLKELARWGKQTSHLESGVVALCNADNGNGMTAYWEEGWLSFVGSEVAWSPIGNLEVNALYCQRK